MTNRNNSVFYDDAEIVYVAGDVHGDLAYAKGAVTCFLEQRKEGEILIFLGDYTDYGKMHIEVVRYMNKMAAKHPDIVLLMGNHEHYYDDFKPWYAKDPRRSYLIDQAERRKGGWKKFVDDHYQSFVNRMYIGAIINNALFVHGGISKKIVDRKSLENAAFREDILWSDPSSDIENGDSYNQRGAGVLWGRDVTAGIPKHLGVQWVIRGHEGYKAREKGCLPVINHEGRVVTVHGTLSPGLQWLLKLNTVDGRFTMLDFDSDFYVDLDEELQYRLPSDHHEAILPDDVDTF